MSEIELLHRLQLLDIRIFELEEKEERLPLKREVEEKKGEWEALQARIESRRGELRRSGEEQRRLEAEIESLSRKIAEEEEKLYGGKISNPKELRGIQAEVQAIRRKCDKLETALLEEIERSEEVEAMVREEEQRAEGLKGEVEEKSSCLEEELKEIRDAKSLAERERGELRAQIPETLLQLYDDLIESKGRLAVVKVVDGICQGCRVALPAQEYDRFLRNDELFRCSNCRRILAK